MMKSFYSLLFLLMLFDVQAQIEITEPTLILSFPPTAYYQIQILDFDHDGKVDILHHNQNLRDGLIQLTLDYENNLAYSEKLFIDEFNSVLTDLHFEDLDNDGDVDMWTVERLNEMIQIYELTDEKKFIKRDSITQDLWLNRTKFADMNGDGHKDFIIQTSEMLELHLRVNEFTYEKIDSHQIQYNGLEIVDFDNDGHLDIVGQFGFGEIPYSVLYNLDGTGQMMEEENIILDYESQYILTGHLFKVADINHDGVNDIIAIEDKLNEKLLSWYDGANFFTKNELITYIDESDYTYLNVHDVNNDGFADLVIQEESFFQFIVSEQQPINESFSTSKIQSETNLYNLGHLFYDINDDGQLEFYHIDDAQFLTWNNEISSFDTLSKVHRKPKGFQERFIDFDDDDDLDLMVFGEAGFFLHENIGDENDIQLNHVPFSELLIENITDREFNNYSIRIHIEGDKIVASNTISQEGYEIYSFSLNENGFDQSPEILYADNTEGISARDFEDINGDGMIDIVFWNRISNTYTYRPGLSDNFFGDHIQIIDFNEGSLTSDIDYHDYDQDGDKDFYFTYDSSLFFKENDPSDPQQIKISNEDWIGGFDDIVFEDIDEDGDEDLLIVGGFYTWILQKNDIHDYTVITQYKEYWSAVDLNEDGHSDLIEYDTIYMHPNTPGVNSIDEFEAYKYAEMCPEYSAPNCFAQLLPEAAELNGNDSKDIYGGDRHLYVFYDVVDIISSNNDSSIDHELSFVASPNPVRDYLTIQVKSAKHHPFQAKIVDQSGRTIKKQYCHSSNCILDVQSFENGIYFLQIIQDQEMQTSKISVIQP